MQSFNNLKILNSGKSSATIFYFAVFLFPALFLLCTQARAHIENDIGGEIRSRYADLESADIPGKSASILLRVNLNTQWNERFNSFVEVDYVADAFDDEFSNGVTMNDKPLFPDVAGEDLNQLWVMFSSDFAALKLGRQAINLDDQRFVSTVAFWQNEQTFDALRLDKPLFSASRFMYSYIANVNRIYGNNADETRGIDDESDSHYRPAAFLGDHKQDSHILHMEINEWDFTQWVLYAYFIDNKDLPSVSNNTLGTRYELTIQPSALRYHVEAEAAYQQRTEFTSSPSNSYAKLFLGASYSSFEVSARYESLGSHTRDGERVGFVTPLGSLNEFQGWADALNTIHGAWGIEDTSVKLKWRHHPWKFDLRYHWFDDTESSLHYGNETDLDITFDLAKDHELNFRFANFTVDSDAELFLVDKAMAVLSYRYDF